jgi:hypothetical protein
MLLAILAFFIIQAPSELSGTKHADAIPAEIGAAISGKLSAGGVKASLASNTLTFWWVKELPMAASAAAPASAKATAGESAPRTAPTWDDVPEGTLVGAVKIDKDLRDIRGRVIRAGVYTLRYGVQPANGDHLGVSPFREFLLLCPAAQDTDAAPRGHDGTIDLSKQTVGGSHPAVWSLDPPVASEAPLTVHTTDLGHKALVMEVPIPGGMLRFGLVLVGKIEA